MLKTERKFPYLRIRVTDGEVRKLPIRKKNPGELLGPLAGASITVTREDRYEAPYEPVISTAIRAVHGGRPPRPERARGPVVARITFGGGQSRERQVSGYARVKAAVEAAEFNELAALEPAGTGPAVPGVPYPRRRGRRGGLIAGVLSVPCELCGAPPGCGCDPVSPVSAEMVRLEKSPPLVVHTGRMAGAITAGAVSRHAVVAQFQENPLPAAVAAAVAAARPRPASRLGAAALQGHCPCGLARARSPCFLPPRGTDGRASRLGDAGNRAWCTGAVNPTQPRDRSYPIRVPMLSWSITVGRLPLRSGPGGDHLGSASPSDPYGKRRCRSC